MQVLHVCSEMFPLLKTGGLADVIGALPAAQIPGPAPASTPNAASSSCQPVRRRPTSGAATVTVQISSPIRCSLSTP